jgi:3',5'-cyclic AMP phosphodiesterase CpdA
VRAPVVELTTVADDVAVVHVGADVRVYDGLRPDTEYELDGVAFCTLPRPGERLATFATVNDVHFGETECGVLGGLDSPVLRVDDGEEPYPEVMNRAAVREIAVVEPDAVIAKGDLTSEGRPEEYAAFLDAYGVFGTRLHHIRGNHDAYHGEGVVPADPIEIVLPGVRIALIDTVEPGRAGGRVTAEQLEWLDELAARADRPVLVLGHHHVWDAQNDPDVDWFFGIAPRDSERLVELVARRPRIVGYSAGHTHRNRVIHLPPTGGVPWGEVACVKDFPGSWAEYRVFEGGILQVHHRISSPEALAWSERTRDLYQPFDYVEYAFGALADRCFAIWPRPGR